MFTRHEVHRKIKKVALEEKRAILLEVVLAKQDAIEAAKQQANDEAEEKGNLKKRKQEEREEMKAAKKAARKFCGACDVRYGNGRDWKECSTCTATLFCGCCIKAGYFVAHEMDCGKQPAIKNSVR
jgi:hypothetical protein